MDIKLLLAIKNKLQINLLSYRAHKINIYASKKCISETELKLKSFRKQFLNEECVFHTHWIAIFTMAEFAQWTAFLELGDISYGL